MKEAYAKPELEICRFDLEEHLAKTCHDRDDDDDDDDDGGCGGHSSGVLSSILGMSLLSKKPPRNGSV